VVPSLVCCCCRIVATPQCDAVGFIRVCVCVCGGVRGGGVCVCMIVPK
jgi:hypothetical protein